MYYYTLGTLQFPWTANAQYGSLTAKENRKGYRSIGGDKGDVRFDGFDSDENGVELYRVTLCTSLDLAPGETKTVALEVIQEAYDSIGAECVEHS